MEFRKMLMITLYAEQKKRHRFIEQSFRLCGRRREWDISREQHRNISVLYYTYLRMKCSLQLSSVIQPCPILCDPMDCSIPGLPIHHQLLEFPQTHLNWVSDAIQPSHPLPSPSSPALNLFQHEGPFQWVSSSHQVAKVLEFQLQHQSFYWTLRTDLL